MPDTERAAYEELARMDGFSDFQITERRKDGLMIRAEMRDEYFPVDYLEPLVGNEKAMGFDLSSNPMLLKSLKSSCDTAAMRATSKIILFH